MPQEPHGSDSSGKTAGRGPRAPGPPVRAAPSPAEGAPEPAVTTQGTQGEPGSEGRGCRGAAPAVEMRGAGGAGEPQGRSGHRSRLPRRAARGAREPENTAPVSLGCLHGIPACVSGLSKDDPQLCAWAPPHQWGAQSVKKEAKAGLPGWDSGTGLPRMKTPLRLPPRRRREVLAEPTVREATPGAESRDEPGALSGRVSPP